MEKYIYSMKVTDNSATYLMSELSRKFFPLIDHCNMYTQGNSAFLVSFGYRSWHPDQLADLKKEIGNLQLHFENVDYNRIPATLSIVAENNVDLPSAVKFAQHIKQCHKNMKES